MFLPLNNSLILVPIAGIKPPLVAALVATIPEFAGAVGFLKKFLTEPKTRPAIL